MKLTDFTTLTFDMMGTLMDYEAGFIAWFRTHAAAGRADVADNQILEALARAEGGCSATSRIRRSRACCR